VIKRNPLSLTFLIKEISLFLVRPMVDVKLSPSKIVTFNKCPRKFWYKYVLKIKEPPTPSTVRGTVFHKVLERFYDVIDVKKLKNKSWPELAETFKQLLHNLSMIEWSKLTPEQLSLFDDVEGWKKETQEFLDFFAVKEAYRVSDFIKNNGLVSDEWFETSFHTVFKPRSQEEYIDFEDVHGYLDKTINLFGKGVGVVDYKTSKTPLPHVIDDSHLLQLKTYAYLFTRKNGFLPKHLSVYYARTGESVYYPVTEKDLIEVKELIDKIKSLPRDESYFPGKVSRLCEYCFYRAQCPYYNKGDNASR